MRPIKLTVAGLVVVATMIGTLACTTASSPARSFSETHAPGAPGNVPQSTGVGALVQRGSARRAGRAKTTDDGAVTKADGALPDGVTVFDDEYPASPTSTLTCSRPSATRRGTLRKPASRSRSTAAGAPRTTRTRFSMRRSPSTGRKRKRHDGSPLRTRPRTCPGTRSTSGPPTGATWLSSTARSTGCVRSIATSPGTRIEDVVS